MIRGCFNEGLILNKQLFVPSIKFTFQGVYNFSYFVFFNAFLTEFFILLPLSQCKLQYQCPFSHLLSQSTLRTIYSNHILWRKKCDLAYFISHNNKHESLPKQCDNYTLLISTIIFEAQQAVEYSILASLQISIRNIVQEGGVLFFYHKFLIITNIIIANS